MDSFLGMIVGDNYKLVEKIGSGHFGVVFRAIHVKKRHEVAVKLEPIREGRDFSMLENEYNVYRKFGAGSKIVPNVYWFGSEKGYNILIMELLGRSLEDLFISCSKHFSLKTITMLADQMITLIQRVHEKNFIHRDITPGNFLVDLGKNASKLFLIDFGYSKTFWDTRLNRHRPNRGSKNLVGTPDYASMNAQKKEDLSRRDDLESLGYILVYFMLGKLPWQNVNVQKPWQKKEKISKIMIATSITSLCNNLPKEFELYLSYCRKLNFQEKPDYAYLRSIFQMLIKHSDTTCDNVFDCKDKKQNTPKKLNGSDRPLKKVTHNSNGNTPDSSHDITVEKLAHLTL